MPATPIDKLNDLICSLENDEHLSPDMNDLLLLLREKQETLPPDADQDTVDEAVRACLLSHQAALFRRLEEQLTEEEAPVEDGLEDGPGYDLEDDFEFDGEIPDWLAQEDPDELLPDDEELRELLRLHSEAGDLIAASLAEDLEAHLQAEDLHYVRTPEEEKPVCYELPFKLKSCLARFLLTVVKTSIIFEIRLPISVDPLYRMVLTSRINDINDELPFGSFRCTKEGIVVLHYMHVTDGSFCEDSFRFLMGGLISHIEENFEELRRMAAGRLHRFHRETLSGQLAELLNDLETF